MVEVEKRRKQELMRRQKAAQDRLVQKNEIKKRLDKEKMAADAEKERQRKEVRVKAEADFQNQIDVMMERQQEQEILIEETKRQKKLEMDRKVRGNMLKRQMKMDKVDRSKRAVEYQREQALSKIEEDAARQRQIKAFKDAVTEERKEMQRQALLQQVEMERKVEDVKKKMRKESSKANASVEKKLETEAEEPSRSAPTSPVKKKRSAKSDLQETDRLPELDPSQTRCSSAEGMTQNKTRSNKSGAKQRNSNNYENMGKEQKALMAEDQVQAMWRNQNERLLRLLEEEEVREAEREQQLKTVQFEMMERRRLEQQYDKERQAARERIVNMTQTHETQLLGRMSELGLIGKDGTGQNMVNA